MERLKVYQAIDTELDYQKALEENPARPDVLQDFHIGDALTAIDYNLQQAKIAWYYDSAPYTNTLDLLRKIAALIVKQGMKHGMPDRITKK